MEWPIGYSVNVTLFTPSSCNFSLHIWKYRLGINWSRVPRPIKTGWPVTSASCAYSFRSSEILGRRGKYPISPIIPANWPAYFEVRPMMSDIAHPWLNPARKMQFTGTPLETKSSTILQMYSALCRIPCSSSSSSNSGRGAGRTVSFVWPYHAVVIASLFSGAVGSTQIRFSSFPAL